MMRNHYGYVHGFNTHDIFLECLQSSVTPAVACKLFQSCYIHVSVICHQILIFGYQIVVTKFLKRTLALTLILSLTLTLTLII